MIRACCKDFAITSNPPPRPYSELVLPEIRITFRQGRHVEALLDGRVRSSRLNLHFIPVDPIAGAFRRAIRDEEFDISEMALVTLAMAHDLGKPWQGLPLAVMRGFHHGALRTRVNSNLLDPHDLPGRKIGVRAYSQTTGVWLRGILFHQYGIAPDRMQWITTEDAHVPDFVDPDYVHRAPLGVSLKMLWDAGEIDAVIGDSSSSFGETRSVIPHPENAAARWFESSGVHPVNHVVALRSELILKFPWIADEIQTLFARAQSLALGGASDPLPYGRPANEKAIGMGLEFAFEQKLTREKYTYEHLFVP